MGALLLGAHAINDNVADMYVRPCGNRIGSSGVINRGALIDNVFVARHGTVAAARDPVAVARRARCEARRIADGDYEAGPS
jgi:hypothetical protein